MHKFFIDNGQNEQTPGCTVVLTGSESRHIALSLRMAVGDEITIATGKGKDLLCVLKRITPDQTEAEVIEVIDSTGEPPSRIRLFQSIPKGDKTESVIQKSVELGVSEIYLVRSERCIVKPSQADARKNERYNRIAYEAAKQCGRGIIPKVFPAVSFAEAVSEAAKSELAFICHETEDKTMLPDVIPDKPPSEISFFIGPEGGFASAEVALAKENGIIPTGLGKRILRTETAPLFVLSYISCRYEI